MSVDVGRVPEDSDEGPGEDAGDGGGGSRATPIEGSEDDGRERGGVDGVGVEGFLEDGLGMQALIERPEAEQNNQQAGDEQDLLVSGFGANVTDKDVVDQVGGGEKR